MIPEPKARAPITTRLLYIAALHQDILVLAIWMAIILASLTSYACQSSATPGSRVRTCTRSLRAGGTSVLLRVFVKDFEGKQRMKKGAGDQLWVDGKKPYGIEGSPPLTETVGMSVSVGARQVAIPREYWRDCFNIDEQCQIWLWYKPDGRLVRFKILASDGAGTYRGIWTLRSDGRVQRIIESLG